MYDLHNVIDRGFNDVLVFQMNLSHLILIDFLYSLILMKRHQNYYKLQAILKVNLAKYYIKIDLFPHHLKIIIFYLLIILFLYSFYIIFMNYLIIDSLIFLFQVKVMGFVLSIFMLNFILSIIELNKHIFIQTKISSLYIYK